MASALTFILSVVIGLLPHIHPVHVSVTDIEFDREAAELQIIVRVFTDDLELEIRNENNMPGLDILDPGNNLDSNDLFAAYLERHLIITTDNTTQSFEYLGFEVEAGAVVSYLLIENIATLGKIEIMNDILVGEFDDQVNLVHVTVDGDISTMKFVRSREVDSRTF